MSRGGGELSSMANWKWYSTVEEEREGLSLFNASARDLGSTDGSRPLLRAVISLIIQLAFNCCTAAGGIVIICLRLIHHFRLTFVMGVLLPVVVVGAAAEATSESDGAGPDPSCFLPLPFLLATNNTSSTPIKKTEKWESNNEQQ